MADEAHLILDRLTDKHELLPFDPADPDSTRVVTVEHGGRTLEVIVPLLYDDTRIGEVVAAAVAGNTAFVLCRHDRPLDDFHGTPGLVVVAVPGVTPRFGQNRTLSGEGERMRREAGGQVAGGQGMPSLSRAFWTAAGDRPISRATTTSGA
jgi:hypothetical protein